MAKSIMPKAKKPTSAKADNNKMFQGKMMKSAAKADTRPKGKK